MDILPKYINAGNFRQFLSQLQELAAADPYIEGTMGPTFARLEFGDLERLAPYTPFYQIPLVPTYVPPPERPMPQSYGRNYKPFHGNPFTYGFGPQHLFFETAQPPVVSESVKNNQQQQQQQQQNTPLEQLVQEVLTAASGGPNETLSDWMGEFSPTDPAMYDGSRGPQAGWVAGAVPAIAGMFGGPIVGGLVGAGMGLVSHAALENAFDRHGLSINDFQGVPTAAQTALSGGLRGALGAIGGLLGFGRDAASVANVAAALENLANKGYDVSKVDLSQYNNWQDFVDYSTLVESFTGGENASDGRGSNTPSDPSDFGSTMGASDVFSKGGRVVSGPGGGLDDLIPATIEGRRLARLSDGEFVIPADVVSMLGDGSTNAGARRLYEFISLVRKNKIGENRQMPPLQFNRIVEEILR